MLGPLCRLTWNHTTPGLEPEKHRLKPTPGTDMCVSLPPGRSQHSSMSHGKSPLSSRPGVGDDLKRGATYLDSSLSNPFEASQATPPTNLQDVEYRGT